MCIEPLVLLSVGSTLSCVICVISYRLMRLFMITRCSPRAHVYVTCSTRRILFPDLWKWKQNWLHLRAFNINDCITIIFFRLIHSHFRPIPCANNSITQAEMAVLETCNEFVRHTWPEACCYKPISLISFWELGMHSGVENLHFRFGLWWFYMAKCQQHR